MPTGSSTGASRPSGLISTVQRVWGPGPLQKAKMKGPAPDRILFQPSYPRAQSADLAQSMLAGKIITPDFSLDIGKDLSRFWQVTEQGGAAQEFAQCFQWLGSFAALYRQENTQAPTHAEQSLQSLTSVKILMESWLDRYERWTVESWSPERLAERLIHLCCHAEFLLKAGDALWRSRLLTAMARQTRYLAQTAHKAQSGIDMMFTALGLNLAGLCLPSCDVAIERGQELLRRELRLHVRGDGGHVSRNPSLQLEIVIRLQMIAMAYEARTLPLPGHIRLAMARMAGMVEFFRCGDGKLAVFNGSCEDDPAAIISASKIVEHDTAPLGFARESRFQRLSAARALVLADVSDPSASIGTHSNAKASTQFEGAGAIQFSSGRSRIVVNCGYAEHLGGDWPMALRGAAAHSGVSLEGGIQKNRPLFEGVTRYQRAEEMSGVLLEITRPFARWVQADAVETSLKSERSLPSPDIFAGHMRRLYLAAGGDDFRGEDTLKRVPALLTDEWRIRFHLHPSVRASLARDGQSVILVLPNQEGWRFRASHPGVCLEKSVYFGIDGQSLATEQIVISPWHSQDDVTATEKTSAKQKLDKEILDRDFSGDIIIKWAFRRLDGV